MSSLDYVPLGDGSRPPLVPGRRLLGLVGTALALVAMGSGLRGLSGLLTANKHEAATRPVPPLDGMDSVLVRPGSASALQLMAPGSHHCVFSYPTDPPTATAHHLPHHHATASDKSVGQVGWVYGVKLEGYVARITGSPADVLQGNLICRPGPPLPEIMRDAPSSVPPKRHTVQVVKADGTSAQAYCYLLPADPFWGRSAQEILDMVAHKQYDSTDLVSAWYHLGQCVRKHSDAEVDLIRTDARCKLLQSRLKPLIPNLLATELGGVWSGACYLKVKDDAFLSTLQTVTGKKAPLLRPKEIAMALKAMSRLGHRQSQSHLIRVLLSNAYERAETFDVKSLVTTLNALSKLDCRPEHKILIRLFELVMKQVRSFDAKNLTNSLNAMARLKYRPNDKEFKTLCDTVLSLAPVYNSQDIAITLNSFSKLNLSPGEAVLRGLSEETLKKAFTFNAQEIANALNAFSNLGHNPGNDVLQTLADEALSKASSFSSQGIALTMNGFAKLEFYPSEALLNALGKEVLQKAHMFNSQGIANTLNAYAKLEHYPGDDLLNVLGEHTLLKASEFNSQGIGNVLNAYAKFGFHPGNDLLKTLVQEAGKKVQPINTQGITSTLHAFCVLDCVDPPLFSRLLSILSSIPVETLDRKVLSQLWTVHLSLKYIYPKLGVKLPPALLAGSFQQVEHDFCDLQSSNFHEEVSKLLTEDLNIPHENEDKRSGLSVDISIWDRKVAIEVDGPCHYVINSHDPQVGYRYFGTTLHKHRLLRAMGWRVVAIPFFKWDAHRSRAEHVDYLKKKLPDLVLHNL